MTYSTFDQERFLPEERTETARRSEFARDRARVLHSSALRRLGAKTQVLSPSGGDFARTRLTHSLEVAQVGREMAANLGTNPDLVDMACLAHDLGHPPFGHNGENALNLWAAEIGGFEGNAQTLRLLTRIEPKVFEGERSYGLNLTRASLDAACKYPWSRTENVQKFGYYEDDREVFEWLRAGAPTARKCVEAQIMDFADDVAYSVHDFEDAIVAGFVKPRELQDRSNREQLIREIQDWAGQALTLEQLAQAFERLAGAEYWPASFGGAPRELGQLKNLTSSLIGSFVGRTIDASLGSNAVLYRYQGDVVTPTDVLAEIAVLKGLVSVYLMSHASRKPFYELQRAVLIELCEALLAANGEHLDHYFAGQWRLAKTEAEQRRVVVDQVATLTDQSANNLHARLLLQGS
jgi:dGTPase